MLSISKKLNSRIARGIATILSAVIAVVIITSGTWSAQASPLGQSQQEGKTLPQGQQVDNSPDSPNANPPCPPGGQCFADMLPGSTFYAFANALYTDNIISGYACGGPGEQCDAYSRPYFRPNSDVTRGQMSKFVDNGRRNIADAIGNTLVISTTAPIALRAQTRSNGEALYGICLTSGNNCFAVTGSAPSGDYAGWFAGGRGVHVLGTDAGYPAIYSTHVGGGTAIYGETSSSSQYGVYGKNTLSNGIGVYGENTGGGEGVHGSSPDGNGVAGSSDGLYGSGVFGNNTGGGHGVHGASAGDGVYGTGGAAGVHGNSSHIGVLGSSTTGYGVEGTADNGVGVYGTANSPGGWAGYFEGSISVTGNCIGCLGPSKIDDPLDPENKYLYHSAVQSPDMLDVYRGHVTLDAEGSATVQLPPYFEALNRDFDYQLTPVGAPMPNLYVAQEVQGNSFKIAGGKPGSKVSWQVTGIRNDPYTNAHPIQPEQDKPADEKGKYLHPTEYGQSESSGVNYDKDRQLQDKEDNH